MLKGITYPVWIGLNDIRGNNKFYWQNSAPVHFTNWDRGEPTSAHQGSHVKNIVSTSMYISLQKEHVDIEVFLLKYWI